MNKEDSKQLIEELRSDRSTLNNLDDIARKYHNQYIPHDLNEDVLFQIELLHEKIGTTSSSIYG